MVKQTGFCTFLSPSGEARKLGEQELVQCLWSRAQISAGIRVASSWDVVRSWLLLGSCWYSRDIRLEVYFKPAIFFYDLSFELFVLPLSRPLGSSCLIVSFLWCTAFGYGHFFKDGRMYFE